MIALPADMPLIRVNRDTLAQCEPVWLSDKIKTAAAAAAVPEWLAKDISEGIVTYLKFHYPGTVIDMPELLGRIRKTIGQLGLDSFASFLSEDAPPVRISLTDLSRRAGTGFELMFFHMLKKQFRAAVSGGARQISCYGLRASVLHLTGQQKWTPRCERLEKEIVTHLWHEHDSALSNLPDLSLTID